jgi:hypothetical protein
MPELDELLDFIGSRLKCRLTLSSDASAKAEHDASGL